MKLAVRVVNTSLKVLTRLACRVDDADLRRVPASGPLILVVNHINFIEVPLMYTHLMPRPVTGFVKTETWDNPATAMLFDLWEAIPIRRGEADLGAMRQALSVLQAGGILTVAPEGTRSEHGRLQRGNPGVVMLAQMSGAPLLPVVYYGGEKFKENIKRLRRTDFHIVVGQPFSVHTQGVSMNRQVRQQIADEIMYQLAALLPPAYRGHYSDLAASTQSYLRFDSPEVSALSDQIPSSERVRR
jgi:1-acyl-sn-glycerol-3-phosphate acyltransferase